MLSRDTHFLAAMWLKEEGQAVEDALESLGYWNRTLVYDGEQALNILNSRVWTFVITAWELPKLGGLRLVKEVRQGGVSAHWPCLVIVPADDENERNIAEGVKIDGFLPRPVTPEKAAAAVQELLDKWVDGYWPAEREAAADALLQAGRPEEALAEYSGVLETGKRQMADVHVQVGLLLKKKGRMSEALDNLERAVLVWPNSGRAFWVLGQTLSDLKRPAEASRALARAASLEPFNEGVKRDWAESLLENDKPAEAEAVFEELLKKHPADAFYLNRLGIALRKQRKYPEAIAHYKRAISILNRDENLYFNLGRCFFEAGHVEKAVLALNQALNLNPVLDSARQLLAKMMGTR